MQKGVLGNFTTFTGKHMCQSLRACNFIKKQTLAQVFFCECCEISEKIFFTERLWTKYKVAGPHPEIIF